MDGNARVFKNKRLEFSGGICVSWRGGITGEGWGSETCDLGESGGDECALEFSSANFFMDEPYRWKFG